MITKDSKVLITGCGGMLGEGVYKQFADRSNVLATDIDLNEPWLTLLDVRKKDDVIKTIEAFQPDYIVHLAALTDMEYCEQNFEDSYRTNTEGVLFLGHQAFKRDIPFLYISTAGIFDGEQDEYHEHHQPHPLSVYGKSKYFGEVITKNLPKSIVIRAGWMMGGGPKKDKKFINKIIMQLRAGKKELHVVDDKLGTPCYTYDLAKSIYYVLDNEEYGVYHGACDGAASRYDVAEYLLELLGLQDEVKLTKVDSSHFKVDYHAPRPYSEKLVNNRLKELNPDLTRDWKVCLKEYVEKFDWEV